MSVSWRKGNKYFFLEQDATCTLSQRTDPLSVNSGHTWPGIHGSRLETELMKEHGY